MKEGGEWEETKGRVAVEGRGGKCFSCPVFGLLLVAHKCCRPFGSQEGGGGCG